MTQPLRVLVVDDHPVVRKGLRAMLKSESWVGEVLEAATMAEAVQAAVVNTIDVVAMDVVLPDGDGIEATRRIRMVAPNAKIMVLTMSDDETTAVRALRAGARGYLLKDTDPDLVAAALQTVARGNYVFSATIGSMLTVALNRAPARLKPPFDKLTGRELQIVIGLADGRSNAEIARAAHVAEKTIRNQLSVIFDKLDVTDRTQAALLARENHIQN